jgi:alpha/beta hydrolase fold
MGDPYFAYGFRAKDLNAPPLISFMGTPPGTTKGADLAVWTDSTPGLSVGETAYQLGKNKIQEFIGKDKCEVFGQSLGGSLCFIYASDHPEQVSKVFSYNPPAPWASTLKQYKKNTEDRGSEPEEVNIFRQEKDPASAVGAGWNEKWNLYRVLPEKPTDFYQTHIRAFSGQKRVMILKMDVEKDNRSLTRRLCTLAFEAIRVPIFICKTIGLSARITGIFFKKQVSRIYQSALRCLFKTPKLYNIPSSG